MDKILIRGLEIPACHGVNPPEKVNPQPFIFDVDIAADFYRAAKRDDLSLTVNYSSACRLITEVVSSNTFDLIEKLAYECVFALFENFSSVSEISLTVWKPQAPMKRKFSNVGVTVSLKRESVYLSLGSSLGDKKAVLDTAIEKLNKTRGISVQKVSEYIATEPYGGVAKNEFLNCAVQISTILPPHTLLDEIQRIEAECGRVRNKRWEDRTLDIDIIFYGDKTIRDERLTVPHRDWNNRDFVKIPLKSIAPQLF